MIFLSFVCAYLSKSYCLAFVGGFEAFGHALELESAAILFLSIFTFTCRSFSVRAAYARFLTAWSNYTSSKYYFSFS